MCDPMTAMLAISVVSAGASYYQGQQQLENSAEAANDATELSYEQNAIRQEQVNDQSALDKSERTKQGMLERAKMATISGESGALGLSSDRLISDSFMQEGTDISSLEKNRLNNQTQSSWDNRQASVTGKSRINEAESRAPTALGTGLQIAGDYMSYKQQTKPKV